jgi:hypothetical protein
VDDAQRCRMKAAACLWAAVRALDAALPDDGAYRQFMHYHHSHVIQKAANYLVRAGQSGSSVNACRRNRQRGGLRYHYSSSAIRPWT